MNDSMQCLLLPTTRFYGRYFDVERLAFVHDLLSGSPIADGWLLRPSLNKWVPLQEMKTK
jgi:hypothetical protein